MESNLTVNNYMLILLIILEMFFIILKFMKFLNDIQQFKALIFCIFLK